jgi:hypothetical protein
LPRGASDASLMPYHVDRSKLFAIERLGNSRVIDAERVAEAIECTRFPPAFERNTADTDIVPRLVQAADLIGQLGDPMYARKVNALFYDLRRPAGTGNSDIHVLRISWTSIRSFSGTRCRRISPRASST